MLRKSLLALIFLSYSLVSAQGRQIEKIYSKCYFEAMPDKGRELKNFAKAYESELVSKGVLEGNTGKSYYKLFKKVITDKVIDSVTNFSFIDSINTLSYRDLIFSNKDCTELIKKHKLYPSSNSALLEKRYDSINFSNRNEANHVFEVALRTLTGADFEIDYYKIRTFLLIDAIMWSSAEVKDPSYTLGQLAGALTIQLNRKNQIMTHTKQVNLEELEAIVREYYMTNKSFSVLRLISSRDAMYANYVDLLKKLNAILTRVKDAVCEKRYNKSFQELNTEEIKELQQHYTFTVFEGEPY